VKPANPLIDFILKEWLLMASGVGLVLTSLHEGHLPAYSARELEVLFILYALFVAVKGLQTGGLIAHLAMRIERGAAVPFKLVVATFFLSTFITNDIALIVIVPLTLALNVPRKGLLVILEALAANAGSALTPFGNPQNLFIYWYYHLDPVVFLRTMAPFALVFLVLLALASLCLKSGKPPAPAQPPPAVAAASYIHGLLLLLVLLSVLRVLPMWTGLGVFIYALGWDRKALRVDYPLLISFFFFFGLAENMKTILASEITHSEHLFLFSALASQVMSNVPAALLFAKFTSNWEALLWGTNAGGFGSLVGSLANLIAYRLYVTHEGTNDTAAFTTRFLVMGYVAFFIAIGLYFLLPGHS
jgi:Na+/H+ antiporter NhaD/arsenite permease-like protein